VANSIDSDVANVGALIRMSGLLPKGFKLASYLEEGRKQLHEETDYDREGRQLLRFQNLLLDAPQFIVPALHEDWCTPSILAMDYVVGIAIEDVENYTQTVRNQIITNLLDLTFRELFEFGLMQTDPNFANYLYKPTTQQIVLLDFGAVRTIDTMIGDQYRALIRAGLQDDINDIMKTAQDIGLFDATTSDAHRVKITQMIRRAFDTIRDGTPVNFCHDDLPYQLQAEGLALLEDGFMPPVLQIDVLLIQRKFAGIFLLATRLKASLDLAAMLQRHIQIPDSSPK
jgi:predicted unusual protein kinase regulating ubiquinone biosynthesis (AarF/ABC1/UbiB family)